MSAGFGNVSRTIKKVELRTPHCIVGFRQSRWFRVVSFLRSYSLTTLPAEKYDGISKSKVKRVRRTPISTLNQHKLLPSDFIHISNSCLRPGIRFQNDISAHPWQMCYYEAHGKPLQFPSQSSGFLYYHQPQDAPLLAGELRFRLTPSNLPQSFSQGKDCLTPDGVVWKIPLLTLYRFPYHRRICRQLQLDGFISDALHSKVRNVVKTSHCPRDTSIILHSLHQVFPINFAATRIRFFALGDSTCRRVDITYPFRMSDTMNKRASPYTSKGFGRFELSTLPEHAGTRTVVLRVVKLVGDPGPYLGQDRPVEGALVLQHRPAGRSEVLSLDPDRDTPSNGAKNFSHPDAFPLLIKNTFGGKH